MVEASTLATSAVQASPATPPVSASALFSHFCLGHEGKGLRKEKGEDLAGGTRDSTSPPFPMFFF